MLILLLIVTALGVSSQSCPNPTVRPAWRTLPEAQRQAYFAAIKLLKARPESTPGGSLDSNCANWNYDQFVQVHWNNVPVAHGVPAFLIWHRHLTWCYEKALQTINPSISLPFWDWTLDSQNPAAADIFAPQYAGGDGVGANHCVMDGVAAGWNTTYPKGNQRPGPVCLTRCFSFTALCSPETVTATINSATNYDALRLAIEGGCHGSVHLQAGGSCGDMSQMYSVNDPLFFLHHAYVDRIFWKWQTACGIQYTGPNAHPSDNMVPFNIPAADAMSTTQKQYCYTYGPTAGDLPLNPQCTAASTAPNATTANVPNANSSTNGSSNGDSTFTDLSSDWFMSAIAQLIPVNSMQGNHISQFPVSSLPNSLITTVNQPSNGMPLPIPQQTSQNQRPLQQQNSPQFNQQRIPPQSAQQNIQPQFPTQSAQQNFQSQAPQQSVNNQVPVQFAQQPILLSQMSQMTQAGLQPINESQTAITRLAQHGLHRRSMSDMLSSANSLNSYLLPEYTPNPGMTYLAPDPLNFTDKHKIRHVQFAPTEWVKMMGMDPVQVRMMEIKQRHIVDWYNNQPDYTSPAALCNWEKHNKLGRFKEKY